MEKSKSIFRVETFFPVLVALLSLLSLASNTQNILSLKNLLSLIGIAGATLYFRKKESYKNLIYIWIVAQMVILDWRTMNDLTGEWIERPFFDLTQVLSFKFGFHAVRGNNEFGVNINWLAVIYLAVLKGLEISSVLGQEVTFTGFRQDSRLGDIFPLTGTTMKRVKLEKDNDWILVKLNSVFYFDDRAIEYVLVKSRNNEAIRQKNKSQIVYFRLVNDVSDIVEGNNEGGKFPFIDWALCR